MVDYNYDDNLQMTLLISGLRPEIKTSVMQHLPFNDVEELITKARHIEFALKAQSVLSLSSYPMNLAASSTVVKSAVDSTISKDLQDVIQGLSDKFEQLSKQIIRSQWPNQPEERNRWQRPQMPNNARRSPWLRSNVPSQQQRYFTPNNREVVPTCWKCRTKGHVQRDCRKFDVNTPVSSGRARSPDGCFRSPSPAPKRNYKGN